MEKILIKYIIQNKNSLQNYDYNCFYYYPDEQLSFRVKDIIKCVKENKNINYYNEKEIHIRFNDSINGKSHWVDIMNQSSPAPININKEIVIKILLKPKNCKFSKSKNNLKNKSLKKVEIKKNNGVKNSEIKCKNNEDIILLKNKKEEIKNDNEYCILDFENKEDNKENIGNDDFIINMNGSNNINDKNSNNEDFLSEKKDNNFDLKGLDFGFDFNNDNTNTNTNNNNNNDTGMDILEKDRIKKEERLKNMNIYEDKINDWLFNKNNKNIKNNILTLLSTLHLDLLKDFPKWESVQLTDLMSESDIKKVVFKARKKLHPDLNSDMDQKTRYLLERITSEITLSFNNYKKNKG